MIKKKSFLVGAITASSLAICTACFVFASKQHVFSTVRGDPSPYSLTLSRSITSEEISAGYATFYNHVNYGIQFNFASASTDSGLVSLATGGYFYNETAITGMTRIEATLTSGSATLSYGNAKDALNVGSQALSGTSLIAVDLAEPSDYFKINDVSGPLAISSLRITYSCSNDYQYAHDREVASGDLLYTSTLSGSLNSNHVVDARCFDVANSSSGYSFHITIHENASGGWPAWYFELKDDITAPSFTLEMYVRGINQDQLNMNLADGSNNALLKSGNRAIALTSEWTVFTVDVNETTLASGKTSSDIKKIKFSQNFGTVASERHVYIDQVRILIPETPTRNNIEACDYVRASTAQTAAASTSFDVTKGSSTSSRILSFADTTGLNGDGSSTFRVFAQFDIAANLGNDNGIDVKACTLSFDIKFSDEIANSSDPNKQRVTIDFTDSTGKASSSWFQMNSITPYGDGWIRYSRNLNGTGAISALSGNVGTIKLGFNGVYTGNQATAHIYIDNIALTAN